MTARPSTETRPLAAGTRPGAGRTATALVGCGAAGLLFLALAALQPAAIPDDDARLQAAWGRVSAVELPPPAPPRPRTPPPPTAPPVRRPPLPEPRHSSRPQPSSAALRLKTPAARIDPLLQNLTLSPAQIDAGSVSLNVDPSATALGGAGDADWLGAVDGRTLAALTHLSGHALPPPSRAGANRKPQWLQRVDPEYPPEALRRNLEGTVTLRLRVDVRGKVIDAEVLDALAGYGFAQAAVAAARQSSFIPGTGADGEAVEQWIKVSYLFQLR